MQIMLDFYEKHSKLEVYKNEQFQNEMFIFKK